MLCQNIKAHSPSPVFFLTRLADTPVPRRDLRLLRRRTNHRRRLKSLQMRRLTIISQNITVHVSFTRSVYNSHISLFLIIITLRIYIYVYCLIQITPPHNAGHGESYTDCPRIETRRQMYDGGTACPNETEI